MILTRWPSAILIDRNGGRGCGPAQRILPGIVIRSRERGHRWAVPQNHGRLIDSHAHPAGGEKAENPHQEKHDSERHRDTPDHWTSVTVDHCLRETDDPGSVGSYYHMVAYVFRPA